MGEVALLATLYPQARFVHLVRDPRDCVLSTEEAWGNSRSARRRSGPTASTLPRRRRRTRAGPLPRAPLRDLTDDVRAQLGRLYDFLGVPTPTDAGRLLRVPENLGAAKGATEVVAGNKQKWKTRMPAADRRAIEELTGDLLDAYGYEREHPGVPTRSLSGMQMGVYRLRDAWLQLQFRRRELGGWAEAVRFLMAR
jgi:hypothetical protein